MSLSKHIGATLLKYVKRTITYLEVHFHSQFTRNDNIYSLRSQLELQACSGHGALTHFYLMLHFYNFVHF